LRLPLLRLTSTYVLVFISASMQIASHLHILSTLYSVCQ